MNISIKLLLVFLVTVLISACATKPPRNTANICQIFSEKKSWYKKANKASERWGSSIAVMMAIMHQESRFNAKARPPRTKILWVLPGPRKSDAYGYPQALDSTWRWYKKSTKRSGADRDNFADAIDFIGWYNSVTHERNKVPLNNAYGLYLAYHEGHGGYALGSYNSKKWLQTVATRVASRAASYQQQLQGCESRFKRSGFRLF